jgi:hypothetical protein
VNPATASGDRQRLVSKYLAMTELLENGQYNQVKAALIRLQDDITTSILDPNRTALNLVITNQIAKLPASSD